MNFLSHILYIIYFGEIIRMLIIDGNSVFEIDEECIKKKRIPKECDIEKYIKKDKKVKNSSSKKKTTE